MPSLHNVCVRVCVRVLESSNHAHAARRAQQLEFAHAGTCILFGDGAGAAVLSAREDGPCALLGSDMRSDGGGYCQLNAGLDHSQAGKASAPERRSDLTAFQNIHMNGQEVFKFAVRAVPDTLNASLAQAGISSSEVDWLVMHQANKRILDAAAKKLGIAGDKVCTSVVCRAHVTRGLRSI
jgi:3-oxoacyl-[acyl-carrier-protein] synthase III